MSNLDYVSSSKIDTVLINDEDDNPIDNNCDVDGNDCSQNYYYHDDSYYYYDDDDDCGDDIDIDSNIIIVDNSINGLDFDDNSISSSCAVKQHDHDDTIAVVLQREDFIASTICVEPITNIENRKESEILNTNFTQHNITNMNERTIHSPSSYSSNRYKPKSTTKIQLSPHQSLKMLIEYDIDQIEFLLLEYGFEMELDMRLLDKINTKNTKIESCTTKEVKQNSNHCINNNEPIIHLLETISSDKDTTIKSDIVEDRLNTQVCLDNVLISSSSSSNNTNIDIEQDRNQVFCRKNDDDDDSRRKSTSNNNNTHEIGQRFVDDNKVENDKLVQTEFTNIEIEDDYYDDNLEEDEFAWECKLLKDSIIQDIDTLDDMINWVTTATNHNDDDDMYQIDDVETLVSA
jgi:hypothetical protein